MHPITSMHPPTLPPIHQLTHSPIQQQHHNTPNNPTLREINPRQILHTPSRHTPNPPCNQSHPRIPQPPHSPIQQQNNNTTTLQTTRACGRLIHARGSTHHQRTHLTNHASNHIHHPCIQQPIHHPPTYPFTHPTTTPQHYKQPELAG